MPARSDLRQEPLCLCRQRFPMEQTAPNCRDNLERCPYASAPYLPSHAGSLLLTLHPDVRVTVAHIDNRRRIITFHRTLPRIQAYSSLRCYGLPQRRHQLARTNLNGECGAAPFRHASCQKEAHQLARYRQNQLSATAGSPRSTAERRSKAR